MYDVCMYVCMYVIVCVYDTCMYVGCNTTDELVARYDTLPLLWAVQLTQPRVGRQEPEEIVAPLLHRIPGSMGRPGDLDQRRRIVLRYELRMSCVASAATSGTVVGPAVP
jgi:hypothetical protein